MRKLIEDLRIGLLGAAAGLFSSSVLLLIDRIDSYYASLAPVENADQFCGNDGFRELWWIPLSFWHVVLSVVASLVVHRYLTKRIRSPFLLWQTVAITILVGWGLTVVFAVSMECVMRASLGPLEHLVSLAARDGAKLAKYLSIVFACNVFYGSVINASSRQYAEQFESD